MIDDTQASEPQDALEATQDQGEPVDGRENAQNAPQGDVAALRRARWRQNATPCASA
jgi:hypothetical protein